MIDRAFEWNWNACYSDRNLLYIIHSFDALPKKVNILLRLRLTSLSSSSEGQTRYYFDKCDKKSRLFLLSDDFHWSSETEHFVCFPKSAKSESLIANNSTRPQAGQTNIIAPLERPRHYTTSYLVIQTYSQVSKCTLHK